jgi:hypothetical protein
LQNTSQLTEKEKKILKEITLKRKGDPHVYHPFLEKSIFKANSINGNLRSTQDQDAIMRDKGMQAQFLSTMDLREAA